VLLVTIALRGFFDEIHLLGLAIHILFLFFWSLCMLGMGVVRVVAGVEGMNAVC